MLNYLSTHPATEDRIGIKLPRAQKRRRAAALERAPLRLVKCGGLAPLNPRVARLAVEMQIPLVPQGPPDRNRDPYPLPFDRLGLGRAWTPDAPRKTE